MKIFDDRKNGSQMLIEKMAGMGLKFTEPLVLGIPRGGVAVGYYIAKSLQCPLDAISARKLPAPGNPEFGFGGVTLEKISYVNQQLASELGLSEDDIHLAEAEAHKEVLRRDEVYRKSAAFPRLAGRTIVLADDGLATGYTMLAALEFVLKQKPLAVIAVSPVAHESALKLIKRRATTVIAAHVDNAPRFSISSFYREFSQLSDEDVLNYLEKGRHNAALLSQKL